MGGGDQQSLWCYYPSTTAQHASVGKEKREFCIKTVAMKDTDMILIIQKAETSY